MASFPQETQRLLTVREVAQRLRLSRWSVYRKIASGELPAVRVGLGPSSPLRVDEAELEQYVYGPPEKVA